MEVLAASAKGATTPGPDHPSSFPKVLVGAMQQIGPNDFTAATLHAVMMRCCHDLTCTPVYIQWLKEDDVPIILPMLESEGKKLIEGFDEIATKMRSMSLSTRTEVLIKIRLSTVNLSAREFYKYLSTYIPGHVENIGLEASFVGSNILLVKVPMVVWSYLRDHPAYAFVDYVQSGNRLIPDKLRERWTGQWESSGETDESDVFSPTSVASSSSRFSADPLKI